MILSSFISLSFSSLFLVHLRFLIFLLLSHFFLLRDRYRSSIGRCFVRTGKVEIEVVTRMDRCTDERYRGNRYYVYIDRCNFGRLVSLTTYVFQSEKML